MSVGVPSLVLCLIELNNDRCSGTRTPPNDAVLLVRGGRDSIEKLRRHAERPARRWLLDGVPLTGISVFAALDGNVEELLARFSSYRFVYTPTVAVVREHFALLATGARPPFTIKLPDTTDAVLHRLLSVLGEKRHNEYHDLHRGH